MKRFGNKIRKIRRVSREDFAIDLEFSDGTKRIVQLDFIFGRPRGLAKEIVVGQLFERCFLLNGALAWPNGYELCPDALKGWASVPVRVIRRKSRSRRAA